MAEMVATPPTTLDDELDSLRADIDDVSASDAPSEDTHAISDTMADDDFSEEAEEASTVSSFEPEETVSNTDDDAEVEADTTDTDDQEDDYRSSFSTEDTEDTQDTQEDIDDTDANNEPPVSFAERVLPVVRSVGTALGGVANHTKSIAGSAKALLDERVPAKFHIPIYALIVLVFVGVPVGTGAVLFLSGGNNAPNATTPTNDTIAVAQTAPNNSVIAPLFTPPVQQWAADIERWTSGTEINPNYLAVVMQMGSCGNPNYSDGGLFALQGAGDNVDAAADAAINRLETALAAADGDWRLALAYYVDGESVLTADFTTWSLAARDMFIIGRNLYVEARHDYSSSQDLQSWLQNTGNARCTDAQQARSD